MFSGSHFADPQSLGYHDRFKLGHYKIGHQYRGRQMVRLVQSRNLLQRCRSLLLDQNDCQHYGNLHSILPANRSVFRVSCKLRTKVTSHFRKQYIAKIPLIQYLTGFATSFLMKPLPKYLGKVNFWEFFESKISGYFRTVPISLEPSSPQSLPFGQPS